MWLLRAGVLCLTVHYVRLPSTHRNNWNSTDKVWDPTTNNITKFVILWKKNILWNFFSLFAHFHVFSSLCGNVIYCCCVGIKNLKIWQIHYPPKNWHIRLHDHIIMQCTCLHNTVRQNKFRPNKLTLMVLVGARTTFSSRTNFFFFFKFKKKIKKYKNIYFIFGILRILCE